MDIFTLILQVKKWRARKFHFTRGTELVNDGGRDGNQAVILLSPCPNSTILQKTWSIHKIYGKAFFYAL